MPTFSLLFFSDNWPDSLSLTLRRVQQVNCKRSRALLNICVAGTCIRNFGERSLCLTRLWLSLLHCCLIKQHFTNMHRHGIHKLIRKWRQTWNLNIRNLLRRFQFSQEGDKITRDNFRMLNLPASSVKCHPLY